MNPTPNLEPVRQAVRVLNEALAADREAVEKLFNHRVRVNEQLAAHPTIQVLADFPGPGTLGVLGLINGLFGVDEKDWGHIASVVDGKDDLKIIRFVVRADFIWESETEPKEDKT